MSQKRSDLVLDAGQMSLHHVMLVHGSEPNGSAHSAHRLRDPLFADLL